MPNEKDRQDLINTPVELALQMAQRFQEQMGNITGQNDPQRDMLRKTLKDAGIRLTELR